jgi:hypothetical protein
MEGAAFALSSGFAETASIGSATAGTAIGKPSAVPTACDAVGASTGALPSSAAGATGGSSAALLAGVTLTLLGAAGALGVAAGAVAPAISGSGEVFAATALGTAACDDAHSAATTSADGATGCTSVVTLLGSGTTGACVPVLGSCAPKRDGSGASTPAGVSGAASAATTVGIQKQTSACACTSPSATRYAAAAAAGDCVCN